MGPEILQWIWEIGDKGEEEGQLICISWFYRGAGQKSEMQHH